MNETVADPILDLLEARGIVNAADLISAARLEGVPLYIAVAVLLKESGGKNIYGHDTGGTFYGAGEVTEANFTEFLTLLAAGGKSNGVGPMQITWPGFFPDAAAKGLRLWVPLDNMRFGLSLIRGYLAGAETDEAIVYAGTRYNGRETYGQSLLPIARDWQARIAAVTPDVPPEPPTDIPADQPTEPDEEQTVATTNIPMSGDQFVASCKRWGLTVVEHGDWRNHNRLGGGRAWGPVNGFMVHNFASDISDTASVNYLINGDAQRGMPGPLSQLALDDEGRVHMIGWGRGNHAGVGDAAVLSRVVNDTVPLNGELKPARDSVDGNARFVGVEMLYGKGPTAKTRAALPLLCAAFLDVMGWGATSVIAHREWTVTRSDPVGFDMGAVRRDVAALLKSGPPGAAKPPVTPPTTPPVKEDDMATDAQIRSIIRQEIERFLGDVVPAPSRYVGDARAKNPNWYAANVWQNTNDQAYGANVAAGQALAILTKMAERDGLTSDEITAAARAGAEEALKQSVNINIGVGGQGA